MKAEEEMRACYFVVLVIETLTDSSRILVGLSTRIQFYLCRNKKDEM